MNSEEKLLTAEEFFALGGDEPCELLDGRIVQLNYNGSLHGAAMTEVTCALDTHVRPRGLGHVLPGGTGIILARNPDRVRGADVCFIAAGRLLPGRLPEGYLALMPDLVIEIVDPGDGAAYMRQKIDEWLAAGVRLVWTVYPTLELVVASEPSGTERVYRAADTLTGAPVLPDLQIRVADLFAE